MKRPSLLGAASLLLFGVGFTVFCYNFWAYSCGHCTLQTLAHFGPFGWLLLGMSGAVGFSLLWLRNRRARERSARCCPCGLPRNPAWAFCPQCGQSVGDPSPGC